MITGSRESTFFIVSLCSLTHLGGAPTLFPPHLFFRRPPFLRFVGRLFSTASCTFFSALPFVCSLRTFLFVTCRDVPRPPGTSCGQGRPLAPFVFCPMRTHAGQLVFFCEVASPVDPQAFWPAGPGARSFFFDQTFTFFFLNSPCRAESRGRPSGGPIPNTAKLSLGPVPFFFLGPFLNRFSSGQSIGGTPSSPLGSPFRCQVCTFPPEFFFPVLLGSLFFSTCPTSDLVTFKKLPLSPVPLRTRGK